MLPLSGEKRSGQRLNPTSEERSVKIIVKLLVFLLSIVSLLLTCCVVPIVLLNDSDPSVQSVTGGAKLELIDRYEMQTNNTISSVLDGVLSIKKVYWLSDDDQVAPEPDQSRFGTTDDPSTLQWLLDDAAELLAGQELYFSTQTQIIPNTQVSYYLDDTILAITWKENINNMTFTISEVKIADASQFRRFLAGGEFGSSVQLTTSEMAESVNAVVAISGDFYKHRRMGIVVYDETLMRFDGKFLDTCYVDDQGNLSFTYRGEVAKEEDAQKYIEDNNIRFSFAFGPVLIDNGQRVKLHSYSIGEIEGNYSRAGIGQKGDLHYIITTANKEIYGRTPNIWGFAQAVEGFGCDKFYTLDGGQTATLVMKDEVINTVDYGSERQISDIIYFATAIPDTN